MHRALIMLAACGGATPSTSGPAKPTPPVGKLVGHHRDPIDVLAALAEPPKTVSWIVPGVAQLELGGPSIEAPSGAGELVVKLFDDQGPMLRVGVALEHVAFALWVERARLLGVVTHDQIVSSRPGGEYVAAGADPIAAQLHPNARVRQLGHRDGWTQIRYLGALEIDGWVPDDALVDHGTAADPGGRFPTGRQTLMVTPGTVVRSEASWSARELGVMANGYFLDTIKELDDAWVEVGYEDTELRVHGFVSKHDPPGRVHKPHVAETPAATITANTTLAVGTCLYATEGGEPIGFVIDAVPAEWLAPAPTTGWFAVGLDTPWGPIVFAARGLVENDLATCGPTPAPPVP